MSIATFKEMGTRDSVHTIHKVGGRVILCWGSTGSGKSTVALNLSFELASLGQRVLLLDADTYQPSIAAMLGLVNAGPGVTAVLRQARSNRLDSDELIRLTEEISFHNHRLRVLVGINAPTRWRELDSQALATLLEFLKSEYDSIIIDSATHLEPGLYSETSDVPRNLATTELIAMADEVLGIFSCDPVGITRFLWNLRDVDFEYIPVGNRLRTSVLGRDPERQVRDTLYQLARTTVSTFVPEDGAALDACQRQAQPLLLAAKSSKTREAIRQLALDLMDQPAK